MSCGDFKTWFEKVTDRDPHSWQQRLGTDSCCKNRLIRIPTGFGKTAGTILPWLFHRVVRQDRAWPTRLVFCLPMRVLVEQTEASILGWLSKAGLKDEVGVHVLLGGHTDRDWALAPERPAILVGTQDMLLSRALCRGYSANRAWWPIDFGLLNNDALWVLDEIQLMDVGLATSAQLAAFRAADRSRLPSGRPFACWWMSATLQPAWLETIDFRGEAAELAQRIDEIPDSERVGGLWAVEKRLERRADLSVTVQTKKKQKDDEHGGEEDANGQRATRGATPADLSKDAAKLADEIRQSHKTDKLTLVVVNTVNKALALFEALKGKNRKAKAPGEEPELILLHSRFRGHDRRRLAEKLREEPRPEGRIVVATQVVEAGVDLSAKVLFTELAPWPSLVQRFGRAARKADEEGQVVVFGKVPTKDAEAAPYSAAECEAAHQALLKLGKYCAPKSLVSFEASLSEDDRMVLYPYAPLHVLRRRDLDGLFDTTPDLSGSDLDISRYIRSGDERDARVFWRKLDKTVPEIIDDKSLSRIERDELCPVPVGDLREHLQKGRKAWRLDYRDKVWEQVTAAEIFPGMTILLDASEGGYSGETGWNSRSRDEVPDLSTANGADKADRQKSEVWQTIAEHDAAVADELREMIDKIGTLPEGLAKVLDLAARLHDWGKSHKVFQERISHEAREAAGRLDQIDLAKAPDDLHVEGQAEPLKVWSKSKKHQGFRHELASALAILELLRRAKPDHEALSQPFAELLALVHPDFVPPTDGEDALMAHPIVRELAALNARDVNLLAFLVCAHHGKVRCAIAATADDQDSGEVRLNGVRTGDRLPAIELGGARLPEVALDLAPAALGLSTKFGASWTERALGLREAFGPFGLAFLEALLRAADMRVSKRDAPEA